MLDKVAYKEKKKVKKAERELGIHQILLLYCATQNKRLRNKLIYWEKSDATSE